MRTQEKIKGRLKESADPVSWGEMGRRVADCGPQEKSQFPLPISQLSDGPAPFIYVLTLKSAVITTSPADQVERLNERERILAEAVRGLG